MAAETGIAPPRPFLRDRARTLACDGGGAPVSWLVPMSRVCSVNPSPGLHSFLRYLLCACCAWPLAACESEQAAAPERTAPTPEQRLSFGADAFDILADDVDGNGLKDLVFTSHQANYSQVFYQGAPREFEAGPRVEDVGFHPGDLLRVPGVDRRLYLMNAEGENALRVFAPAEDGSLARISEMGVPAPRTASFFRWPDAGLGLAVAPFGRNAIFLITEFDAAAGSRGPAWELPLESSLSRVHEITAADLDGDGSDEVLFADPWQGVLYSVSAPAEETLPEPEAIWSRAGGESLRVGALLSADLDADGTPDIAVAEAVEDEDGGSYVRLLLNRGDGRRGDGRFEAHRIRYPEHPGLERSPKGVRSMAFARAADGSGLLLLSSEQGLALLRLPKGWSGEQPESRTLPFAERAAVRRLLLTDLDGDGALDAVAGHAHPDGAGYLLYGPLWDAFAARAEADHPIQ